MVLGPDNNLLDAASQTKLFAKSGVAADAVNVPGGWKTTPLCRSITDILRLFMTKQAEEPAEKPEGAGGKRPEMARDL